MDEQRFDATQIIFYVHGLSISLSPAVGYVHGVIASAPESKSLLRIARDEKTGKVRIHIEKK
jgi:hypothetical protein